MAKQNTIENDKTYLLADLLDCEQWAALGLMEAFYDWASKQARDGNLTGKPVGQIADGVKWRGKPAQLMHLLRLVRIVDLLPDGTLYIHDYHDHAPDFVRRRMEREGKKFANGLPARMPKEGYKEAGFDIPQGVPYLDNVESPPRQNTPKPAQTSKQSRVTDSPKPDENPQPDATLSSLVRAEAQPSPAHNREDLVINQDLIGETGFSDEQPPGGGANSGSSESGGMVGTSGLLASSSGSNPNSGLPTAPPKSGSSIIAENLREGETEDECRRRLLQERRAELARQEPGSSTGTGTRSMGELARAVTGA